MDRGWGYGDKRAESGVEGAESGLEWAETGVDGAGSGGRGGGIGGREPGKIGREIDFFYRKFKENGPLVGFQLEFVYCPSKDGDCRENEIIIVGCLFTFGSCHSEAKQKHCPSL